MRSNRFTCIELLIVVMIVVIVLGACLIPTGYVGYRVHKENVLYEQFNSEYHGLLTKGEFLNVLNRHPDGTYPIDPREQEKALKMSVEIRAVAENDYNLDTAPVLNEWIKSREKAEDGDKP